MRCEASIVPGAAAGRHQSPRDRLGIGDQLLVIDLDAALRRQYLAPMRHQLLVLAMKEDEAAALAGKIERCVEVGHEYRKTGVHRVPRQCMIAAREKPGG
jgi:hypothetical protein